MSTIQNKLDINAIRAKLAAQAKNEFFEEENNAFLAVWNVEEGKTLKLRFLEDSDPDNSFFWRERDMINLDFPGVVGNPDARNVRVVVPCADMWGKDLCPILRECRQWYKTKDDDLAKLASKYWKKRTYLMQCFIAPDSAPVKDDVAPENPIRRVLLSKQIFERVHSIFKDPDVAFPPTHSEEGFDFYVIKKKDASGYYSYNDSNYARKSRPLNEEERAAIEKYGLHDLKNYLPERPSDEHLQAIKEMFEASVNGELYDPNKWGQYYRPAGVKINNTTPSSTASVSVQNVVNSGTTPSTASVASTPSQPQESNDATPSTPSATSNEPTASSVLLSKLKNLQAQKTA